MYTCIRVYIIYQVEYCKLINHYVIVLTVNSRCDESELPYYTENKTKIRYLSAIFYSLNYLFMWFIFLFVSTLFKRLQAKSRY